MHLQLCKDFEEDKQQAISRALTQAQCDVDTVRRQTEERCKDELAEEIKKVVQKHKAEISATKKKQWVSHLLFLLNLTLQILHDFTKDSFSQQLLKSQGSRQCF